MSHRLAGALATGSFVVSSALCVVAAVVLVLEWDTPLLPRRFGMKEYAIAFSLVIGGVGPSSARGASNPIGWIFCGLGVLAGMMAVATEYAPWTTGPSNSSWR